MIMSDERSDNSREAGPAPRRMQSQSDSRVGLFLARRDSKYQRVLEKDAKDAARRHGLALEVMFSDNFAAQQAQDIMRFVHANPGRPLSVVVFPLGDASQGIGGGLVTAQPEYKLARRVIAKGVGWITLNREAEAQTLALRQEFPSVPVGVVTPDQKEVGRLQGRQFKALLPHGGRLLYVLGIPNMSSAIDRRAGMLEEIEGHSIDVSEVDGLWSRGKAQEAVYKRILALKDEGRPFPQVVGCQNDAMAMGAREALGQAAQQLKVPSLRNVRITGVDGVSDEGQQWVAEGMLTATIKVPSTSGRAIDLMAHAWSTGSLPVKAVQLPVAFPSLDRLRATANDAVSVPASAPVPTLQEARIG